MASNIFSNERSLASCIGSQCSCSEHCDRLLGAIPGRCCLLVVE